MVYRGKHADSVSVDPNSEQNEDADIDLLDSCLWTDISESDCGHCRDCEVQTE
jgi:hypothetical protein